MVAYGEHVLEGTGVKVWVRPKSLFRRTCDKWHLPMPYFHFQKPQWNLYVEGVEEAQKTDTLYWWLKLADGRMTGPDVGTEVRLPKLKVGKKRRIQIVGGRLIAGIGQTALCIAPVHWLASNEEGKLQPNLHMTLCEFNSTAEEEYFVPFVAALFAGAIAGLIVFLLTHFIN